MNGVYNAIFIVLLMMFLVATDYVYTIGDNITSAVNNSSANISMTYGGIGNTVQIAGYQGYANIRTLLYTAIVGILVPFLIFLVFASSFINRNQDIATYLVSSMAIMLVTPLCIYIFSDVITQMLNVPILNPAYMATTIISNFMFILIVNMLLSLASFVFIFKGGMRV